MVGALWARGLALFVGALALIDLMAASARPALSGWLVSQTLGPLWLRLLLLAGVGALLLAHAWRPATAAWRHHATQAMFLTLMVRCTIDAFVVHRLFDSGKLSGERLPLSLALALAFLLALVGMRRQRSGGRLPVLAVASGCAVLFALGQMVCFGHTDYRRRADAVVVFGARVYADGSPSLALDDRVRTAAALVREGYAPTLIVSGGPGDGDIHEVETMRDIALAEGVPAHAIVMDRAGLSTRDTTVNTARLVDRDARILAVSHSYHLPRIKLSFQQQNVDAYTVPAVETRSLLRMPWYMTREVAAFWLHALRVR